MTTRVLLAIVCLLPVIIGLVGEYLDWDPRQTFTVVAVVNAGPAAVLTSRTATAWIGMSPTHIAPWTEWTTAVTPAIVAVMVLGWAYRRSIRDERAPRSPDSWCARCDTALYADHAGRYYSRPDCYLCPPELRQPRARRHQPGTATP